MVAKQHAWRNAAARRLAEEVQALVGLKAYLAGLPDDRRQVLEELAQHEGQASIEAYAVHLLRGAAAHELKRRAGLPTRPKLRNEQFARRWAYAVAKVLSYAKSAEACYLVVHQREGRVEALAAYPGATGPGASVLKLDWAEVRDEAGAVTAESVGAWLSGRARPRGGDAS